MYHFQIEVFIDEEDKEILDRGQVVAGANAPFSDAKCLKIIIPNTWVSIDEPDDDDDDDFLRYLVTPQLNM